MANQSWAPQSPDLSAYVPRSPDLSSLKQQQQPHPHLHPHPHHHSQYSHQHTPTNNTTTSWAPQSPDLSGQNDFHPRPGGHHQQQIDGNHHVFPPQPPHFTLDGGAGGRDPRGQIITGQPYTEHTYAPFYQIPHSHPAFDAPPNDMPATTRAQRVKKEEDGDWNPHTRNGAPPAMAALPQHYPQPDHKSDIKPPPPSSRARPRRDTRGVEVKTKFPTARIKRIMQADEDVGKVAQVTPVVMAKALELFMIRLITASADIARSKNSKRVQTAHMKQAVMADDQFDNLREIVGKVPDAPQKKAGAAGKDSESDEDQDAPKKRKKSTAVGGGGAKGKKRRGSDDDF